MPNEQFQPVASATEVAAVLTQIPTAQAVEVGINEGEPVEKLLQVIDKVCTQYLD